MSRHGRFAPSFALATSLCLTLICTTAGPIAAQGSTGERVQVDIEGVGPDGLSGIALLSPSATSGTDIQILIAGAKPETFAAVHAGTCTDIDPAPTALIGDVGAGGDTHITIADAFESIADGAHVLALHAGLDLAAAIGCGEIPVSTAPPAPQPTPTGAPQGTGGTYTGPTVGFTVAWDGTWTEYPIEGLPGTERVALSNGVSSVVVSGVIDPAADALACVRVAEEFLLEQLRTGSVTGLEPLSDATGKVISGGDAARAWVGYRYNATDDQGNEALVAAYHECRTSGTVQVRIEHQAPTLFYDQQAEARESLLAGLTLPETPPQPPAPTEDPACAGLAAWVDATTGRFDRITELRAEADDMVERSDTEGYKASLPGFSAEARRMSAEQQNGPVPPVAVEANVVAVKALDLFMSAADQLVRYYAGAASPELFNSAIGELRAADAETATLRADVADLQAAC